MDDNISITSKIIASLIEVGGGQPFDSWKVHRQVKRSSLNIKQLWRASGISSFHRVFFYMPSIYVTDKYLDNNLSKITLVPFIVTPHVAFFENFKTRRQLGLAPRFIIPKSFTATYFRELFYISGMTIVVPELKKRGYGDISSSVIAAVATQVANQPFDTIKTIQEHRNISFSKAMIGQNIKGLWKGVTPRVLRAIWTFYCMNYIAQALPTW